MSLKEEEEKKKLVWRIQKKKNFTTLEGKNVGFRRREIKEHFYFYGEEEEEKKKIHIWRTF